MDSGGQQDGAGKQNVVNDTNISMLRSSNEHHQHEESTNRARLLRNVHEHSNTETRLTPSAARFQGNVDQQLAASTVHIGGSSQPHNIPITASTINARIFQNALEYSNFQTRLTPSTAHFQGNLNQHLAASRAYIVGPSQAHSIPPGTNASYAPHSLLALPSFT